MPTQYTDEEIEEAFKILDKAQKGLPWWIDAVDLLNKVETRLASTPQAPETFEKFGSIWIKHMPGDPQPIADDVECFVLLRGDKQDYNRKLPAFHFLWNKAEEGWSEMEIIGYRMDSLT